MRRFFMGWEWGSNHFFSESKKRNAVCRHSFRQGAVSTNIAYTDFNILNFEYIFPFCYFIAVVFGVVVVVCCCCCCKCCMYMQEKFETTPCLNAHQLQLEIDKSKSSNQSHSGALSSFAVFSAACHDPFKIDLKNRVTLFLIFEKEFRLRLKKEHLLPRPKCDVAAQNGTWCSVFFFFFFYRFFSFIAFHINLVYFCLSC